MFEPASGSLVALPPVSLCRCVSHAARLGWNDHLEALSIQARTHGISALAHLKKLYNIILRTLNETNFMFFTLLLF